MPPCRWGLTLCVSSLRRQRALHAWCFCDAKKSFWFCRLIGLKSSYFHTQMLSNPVTPLFKKRHPNRLGEAERAENIDALSLLGHRQLYACGADEDWHVAAVMIAYRVPGERSRCVTLVEVEGIEPSSKHPFLKSSTDFDYINFVTKNFHNTQHRLQSFHRKTLMYNYVQPLLQAHLTFYTQI